MEHEEETGFVALYDDGDVFSGVTQRRQQRRRSCVVIPEIVMHELESPSNFAGYCVQGHDRSEEHTSELQSRPHLVCRLLLEKKKKKYSTLHIVITSNSLGESGIGFVYLGDTTLAPFAITSQVYIYVVFNNLYNK